MRMFKCIKSRLKIMKLMRRLEKEGFYLALVYPEARCTSQYTRRVSRFLRHRLKVYKLNRQWKENVRNSIIFWKDI